MAAHESSPSSSPPLPPGPDPRLTRLEEHAAFTEHTVDQLSSEIIELNARLNDLAKKLGSLEARLGKLLDQASQDDHE